MMDVAEVDYVKLGEAIQALEFDTVFTLHADGTIVPTHGTYAPQAYIAESDGDCGDHVLPDGWKWATRGMSAQWGYSGPVMHASEYIGDAIAGELHRWTEDGPQLYAIIEVGYQNEDGEFDETPAGWAIVRKDAEQ
jgi:hypothetical protein